MRELYAADACNVTGNIMHIILHTASTRLLGSPNFKHSILDTVESPCAAIGKLSVDLLHSAGISASILCQGRSETCKHSRPLGQEYLLVKKRIPVQSIRTEYNHLRTHSANSQLQADETRRRDTQEQRCVIRTDILKRPKFP